MSAIDKRFRVLERLKTGKITNLEAAKELKITTRQIKRLKKRHDSNNINVLEHKNIGRKRSKKLSDEKIEKIIKVVRQWNEDLENKEMPSLFFTNALFKINNLYNLNLKYTYFKKLLNSHNIISDYGTPLLTPENKFKLCDPRNEKKPGEEWQADGTFAVPFNGKLYCAHVIVDCKTNAVLSIFLDNEETTYGYLNAFKMAFKKYGIPKQIVTDKRRTFHSSNEKSTQVVLREIFEALKINLICDSNPRRKNKIESKNRYIKTTLVSELALSNIKTLTNANDKLQDMVILLNKQLKNDLPLKSKALRNLPLNYNFEIEFSKVMSRTITSNCTINYESKEYLLIDNSQNLLQMRKGKKVNVRLNYEKKEFVLYNKKKYKLLKATKENLDFLVLENQKKEPRKIGADGYTLSWKKRKYHLLNQNGNSVKFEVDEDVDFYFKSKKGKHTPVAAKVDGKTYKIKLFKNIVQARYKIVKRRTTKNIITIEGFKYKLINLKGEPVNVADGSDLSIEIKDDIPMTAIVNNKKYKLHNISINSI